jgi:hypothetical protein
MSTPLSKVKHVALIACVAWALSLVAAAAAPAKDDHKGPDAPPPAAQQHDQDKAAKDADKAAEQAAKDAEKAAEQAQKDAEKAAEQAAKDAEKAAKDAAKAQEKAQKEAEKQAKKDKGKQAAPAPAPFVEVTVPSVAPRQEIAGQTLRACTSRRLIQIRLRHPRGSKFRSATVTLNGKRIAARHGKRITAPIDLRGLPQGTYKVVIRAVTTKGKVVRGTRTYHTCVGPRPHRAPKL